jgi:hypothetical protein
MLGQKKGLLLVNRIIVPLPYPRIAPTDQSHENSESTTNNDNSTEEGEGEAVPSSWNDLITDI